MQTQQAMIDSFLASGRVRRVAARVTTIGGTIDERSARPVAKVSALGTCITAPMCGCCDPTVGRHGRVRGVICH